MRELLGSLLLLVSGGRLGFHLKAALLVPAGHEFLILRLDVAVGDDQLGEALLDDILERRAVLDLGLKALGLALLGRKCSRHHAGLLVQG